MNLHFLKLDMSHGIQNNMSGLRYRIAAVLWVTLAAANVSAPQYGERTVGLSVPVTIVQTDSHHPGTLLAGSATAQLFRSRDGAESWTPLPFPMAFRSTLHTMLIDPTLPDTYLVGLSSEAPDNAGIFRTTDEGATWYRLQGLERKQVWALALWAGDSHVIAAGTPEGVFRTLDGGENWTRLGATNSALPRPVVSLAFDPKDRNTLYAGTPHLAWKTSDGGASWHRLSRGMQADSDIFSIDVDPDQRSRLFAGACGGLYSSINGGGTWSTLERAIGGPFRTYAVARSPGLHGVVFAATSDGLIRSSDGGATWHRVSAEPARSIAFDPADPLRIFVATDHGIILSQDAGMHFRGPGAGRDVL
jgi:photosystem II stability/assembly factor-like uncharacterized protein